MNTHVRRRRPWPETDLLPEEQSELALKIRYGIGLAQLVGPSAAALLHRRAPASARAPWQPAEPPPEPTEHAHAKAAALGLGAGRRGQWLRR